MIIRREPSHTWPTATFYLPCYRCKRCDVLGRGESCWMCGGTDLEPTPSVWIGSAVPNIRVLP